MKGTTYKYREEQWLQKLHQLAAVYLEETKLYPKLEEQFAIENSLDINYK